MRRTLDTIIYEDEDNDINFWLDSFNKISLKEFINRIIEKKDIQQMNKQELQDEIIKTKEHLANMEKMLKQCEYERWKPKDKQKYWTIDFLGGVHRHSWFGHCYDKERYKACNCFQTREQAEAEVEKILIRRQLEDIARRLNEREEVNYEANTQCKFCLTYNIIKDRVEIDSDYNCIHIGIVYCLSMKFYDVAIQEIGEERLKKYLRGE